MVVSIFFSILDGSLDLLLHSPRYRKIKEQKIETSIEVLCSGFPEEFSTYLQYVRSM